MLVSMMDKDAKSCLQDMSLYNHVLGDKLELKPFLTYIA